MSSPLTNGVITRNWNDLQRYVMENPLETIVYSLAMKFLGYFSIGFFSSLFPLYMTGTIGACLVIGSFTLDAVIITKGKAFSRAVISKVQSSSGDFFSSIGKAALDSVLGIFRTIGGGFSVGISRKD
jgi:hypothetical protein